MSIESELLQIKGNKEFLIPEEAVTWAEKHPKSALHKSLQWDDARAGHEYRVWQVRRLIAIHITYEGGERKLVSLKIDRSSPGGYRHMDQIMAREDLWQHMLDDALAELNRVRAKYEALKALKPVWAAVSAVSRKRAKTRKAKQKTGRKRAA
jgi:hypothetical protein